MTYQDLIRQILARDGYIGYEPRHVEAWMRLEHGTLDNLPPDRFRWEVRQAVRCIQAKGPDSQELSEGLAVSYGL